MPWNPQVQDRRGEFILAGAQGLGQGLQQGMQNFAEAFAKKQEKDKQIAAGGKIADTIVKTYPDMLKRLGLSEDEFRAMSARDKSSTVTGVIQGMANERDAKRAQQQDELYGINMKTLGAELAAKQAAQERQAKLPEFLAAFQANMSGEPGADGPMPKLDEMGAMIRANKSAPAMAPEFVQKLMLSQMTRKAAPTLNSLPRPKDGAVVTYGNNLRVIDPEKPSKVRAPAGPDGAWIYTADEKDFQKQLSQIDDPEVRDAILETRNHYRQATQKPTDPNEIFKFLGGGGATNAPAKGSLLERFKNFKP